MVNARFGSGTQAIKALPDFMGLHMHVTSHRESNGYYSQFHVKFDFGTGHISLFYNFPTGAFSHYGQNERDRKKLIGDWSKDHSVLKFNTTTATFKSESDRIARDIVAILNAP